MGEEWKEIQDEQGGGTEKLREMKEGGGIRGKEVVERRGKIEKINQKKEDEDDTMKEKQKRKYK